MELFKKRTNLCILAALLLAGCSTTNQFKPAPAASSSPAPAAAPAPSSSRGPIPRPAPDQPVIVKNFSTADTQVPVAKDEQPWIAQAKKSQAADYLSSALIADLRARGFNAMAFKEGASAPDGSLIIDGVVHKIGEDSGVSVKTSVSLYRSEAPGTVLAGFDASAAEKGPGKWDDLAKNACGKIADDIVNLLQNRVFAAPAK